MFFIEIENGGRWREIDAMAVDDLRRHKVQCVEMAGPEAKDIIDRWTEGAPFLRALYDMAERVAHDFPDEPWAEQALDAVASYHVRKGDDDVADTVFRRLYDRYPRGNFAERAASTRSPWKARLAPAPAAAE